ncbi:MAG TPA: rubredoxin [Bacillota bacterium]|nr:rubredoxin [Bacillota bacterium]
MDLKALFNLSYGLYVICGKKGERFNGQIANTVFQVSGEPASIAISLNKQNLTHEFVKESRVFTVSVLTQSAPLSLIGHFGFKSGRQEDKFAGANFEYRMSAVGLPYILSHTCSFIEAVVTGELDAGSHTVFLADVKNASVFNNEPPMTYAYYHQVKRGSAPKAAPLPAAEKPAPAAEIKHASYRCTVCGYVYDPEKGDPENGIAPGTAFEQLPESWTCPVCGAAKDMFEKEE